jgi:predicted house-cleaning noncanonical NTP pyrophosphatase (MazG superfamily)
MKHNKLVRDNIPDIVRSKGEEAVTHVADDAEYWEKLKEKVLEEFKEFTDEENEEELADRFEVLDAIIAHKGFTKERIVELQKEKAQKRGGFSKRIILDES